MSVEKERTTEEGEMLLRDPEIVQLVRNKVLELRKKLLDLGRRNPLVHINFRPTSMSVIRIVDELPDVLRFKLNSGQSMRLVSLPALGNDLPDEQTEEFKSAVFIAQKEDQEYREAVGALDPAKQDYAEREQALDRDLRDRVRKQLGLPERQTKDNTSLSKHALAHGISPDFILPHPDQEHDDGRHQDNDIQTLMLPERLTRVGKRIVEKGRSFERETGVSVLHAVFGVLEWKPPFDTKSYISPLLLQQIAIERRQSPSGAEFFVSGTDSSAVNSTLKQKLQSEYQLVLPDYAGGDIEAYIAEVREIAPQGWQWEVRREVVLGVFPSSKMAMFNDLDPDKRSLATSPLVAKLLATVGVSDGTYAETHDTDAKDVARRVQHLVLDADASQFSVLVDVAAGKNLALEGPPGSGKSQTIVNLIAAALFDGKKVLFVAEKLTALNVVKSRLDAVGLGDFVLPLQVGRAARDAVYDQLAQRLSLHLEQASFANDFDRKKAMLDERRTTIQRLLDVLGANFAASERTVHEVLGWSIATAQVRATLPSAVRNLNIYSIRSLDRAGVAQILTNANTFAQQIAHSHSMPRLWIESRATVVGPEESEDLAELAGQLANGLEEYKQSMSDSGFAEVLAQESFSPEIKPAAKIIQQVAAAPASFDFDVLEELIDLDYREQTTEMLGDIDALNAAMTKVAKSLKDPVNPRLGDQLLAALTFAGKNDRRLSPRHFREKAEGLAEERNSLERLIQIAEPIEKEWTANTPLSEIQAAARSLLAFSEAVQRPTVADPQADLEAIAADLAREIDRLTKELQRLKRTLPGAGMGRSDASEVRDAASIIKNAGTLSWLSRDYKSALALYVEELGGSKANRRGRMANGLFNYADYLDRLEAFETDRRYTHSLGDIFNGLETDLRAVDQLVALYHQIDLISGDDPKLRSQLRLADLTPLRAIAESSDLPNETLQQFKERAGAIERDHEYTKLMLAETEEHLAIFKTGEEITLEALEDICRAKAEVERLGKKIERSSARSLLEGGAADPVERSRFIATQCAFADQLDLLPHKSTLLQMLRSADLGHLGNSASTLAETYTELEDCAGELAKRLDLPADQTSVEALAARIADLREASQDHESLLRHGEVIRAEAKLRDCNLDLLVDAAKSGDVSSDPEQFVSFAEAIIAGNMANAAIEVHRDVLYAERGHDLDRIRAEFAQLDKQLIELSQRLVRQHLLHTAKPPRGINVGKKSSLTDLALISNELQKTKRRLSIRDLTHRARSALLELQPCWMMSPQSVAQYLQGDAEFDLLVVDEASQMTPENAMGAISRARQVVIVGDTKQLPPTSFFQKMLDDSETDQDLVEDSESVLEMANNTFAPPRQLSWHYRSRHPGLIAFSNRWMYDNRLTVFPRATEDDTKFGVSLVEVDGLYIARRNIAEAKAVVQAIGRFMREQPNRSLGVCTMNIDQKELIDEEFEFLRDRDRAIQKYVERWEEKNNGVEEFFVRNLETIQGDERDVMFISTGFGPEQPGGKVHQRFFPITTAKGDRRLNVLFTRAKEQIVTFTSLKPTDVNADPIKSKGVQMFRNWLEYSKTGHVADLQNPGPSTESPFEDHVIRQIESLGCEAVPQVGIAGYRIDIGVRHPDWPYGFVLGVECDGATYHSSRSSRERDRLRQEVLEGLGWTLHRIWSTDWFRSPKGELDRLKQRIDERVEYLQKQDRPEPRRAFVDEEEHGLAAANEDATSAPAAVEVAQEASLELLEPELQLPIQQSDRKTVGVGSKVKIEHLFAGGEKMVLTLIAGENDPENGLLSVDAPLGEALLDAQEGDKVEYQVGRYIREARILSVEKPT